MPYGGPAFLGRLQGMVVLRRLPSRLLLSGFLLNTTLFSNAVHIFAVPPSGWSLH